MSYPMGNLFIQGPAGPLECLIKEASPGAPWAVISHAHPLHGGVMFFKVLHRMARVLHEVGYSVFRYNFRGVGRSAGVHDHGTGELEDLRAVVNYLETERGQGKVLLAGYSFGSWISARLGMDDPRVWGLLHAGLAARFFELKFLASCPHPTAVVQGDRDHLADLADVEALVHSMPRAHLYTVHGADHFFEARLDELEASVREAAVWLREQA